jgi:hypothetical protein
MASEILPALAIRAQFCADELIPATDKSPAKYRIDFAVESINKNGSSKTRIPLELAAQIGAYLSVKLPLTRYDICKHFFKQGRDLLITVSPTPWKVGEGSGVFYDLIEVETLELST